MLEATLAEPRGKSESDSVQDAFDSLQSPDEEARPSEKSPPEPSFQVVADTRCTAGVEADVNVLMPDRYDRLALDLLRQLTQSQSRPSPMDLQLTMSCSADLPESQQPLALQKYSEDLSAL